MLYASNCCMSEFFLINRDYFEAILIVIGIVGTLIGVPLFYYERRRERAQREHGTYLQVHDNYLEYLKLCLENPDVDVLENHPHRRRVSDAETEEALRKRSILFSYFVSMAEQAFIAYENCSGGPRARQWEGWVAYIDEHFRHESFLKDWKEQGRQFDSDFLRFMNSRAELAEKQPLAPPPTPSMEKAGKHRTPASRRRERRA